MTSLSIEIGRDELSGLMAPWIIREYPRSSLEWRRIQFREARRMWRKRRARAMGSLLSSAVPPTKEHRTPAYVNERYSESWDGYRLPVAADLARKGKRVFLEWGRRGYAASPIAAHRCHLLGISRVLDRLRPSSVLEVGAGPGITLFALSSIHPEIAFTGVELTAAGVAAALSLQVAPLPECIGEIAPLPVRSRTAHRRISFNQGDARALPFPDQSFDMVVTRQAIEQMEQIHPLVFAEINRVARGHAVFVEPFPDFNRTWLQRFATATKNYISVRASRLGGHGFEPILRFADWPHKITNGVGMVVCRRLPQDGAGAGLLSETRRRPAQPV